VILRCNIHSACKVFLPRPRAECACAGASRIHSVSDTFHSSRLLHSIVYGCSLRCERQDTWIDCCWLVNFNVFVPSSCASIILHSSVVQRLEPTHTSKSRTVRVIGIRLSASARFDAVVYSFSKRFLLDVLVRPFARRTVRIQIRSASAPCASRTSRFDFECTDHSSVLRSAFRVSLDILRSALL